jgi:hypothetical protein
MTTTSITAKRPRLAAAIERELFTIIAAPAFDRDGNRLHGKFNARLGDRVLVAASRQPLLDGARALLELGYDLNATVVMRHAGSTIDSLRTKIGDAARLTVEECSDGRPRFRSFRPRPSEGSAPVASLAQPAMAGPEWVAEAAK